MVRAGRSSFAAAVLVDDGRLAFARAYGVEGPGAATPFSLDSTEIDLNSIIKLFCAVSIAQLVDRGVIKSIDDPVNLYLKHFKLPPAFGHDVTIRAVATHSAGFDLESFGAGPLESNPAAFLQQRFPGYFDNSGYLSAYDSYGAKLLAYMVSEITGQPFPRYVEESILKPLGMDHTFLVARSTPLTHRVIAFQVKAPSNTESGPPLQPMDAALLSGVAVSTMSDMAKFVAALLGPAASQRTITQPMRDLMFRVLQSNGDGGAAHGLLFDAQRIGKKTMFVHGALGPGMTCMMALDVMRQAGIFYCYGNVAKRFHNDPANSPLRYETVIGAMLEPFIACAPDTPDDCPRYPPAVWRPSWAQYVGDYIEFSRHHAGFSTIRTLLHPNIVHISKGRGSLAMEGEDGFVEIAPGVFANPRVPETFGFTRVGPTGKLVLSVSNRPSAYELPKLVENPKILPRFLALLLLIALSGGLIVLFPRYGLGSAARHAVALYCFVVLSGIFIMFGLRAWGPPYFDGIAWPLNIVRCLAFASIPASALLVLCAWRENCSPHAPRAWPARLHLNVLSLSSVLLVATLLTVHLISFSPIL
jgi:CubicO group peptidase (beta-lactamase class C family)